MTDVNADRAAPSRSKDGFEDLLAFWSRLDELEATVGDLSENALTFLEEPIERVAEKIRAFEPSVSVIGQVKAGKSTLLNAMIGRPGLLPSDVNPWTSVITAVHLNSHHRPYNTRALFRFFDAEEWDRLVATGGRLGEMASRAGFEAEADEIRAQVVEMRMTTESRFGDTFESLLGNSHAFPEVEKDLIDRYICYGDPDDIEDGATEGVYADITKLADLYIDLPELPRGLCIRDTPGVNDTFMMREQITLNAISDSRVCVVVLSAHQALSTMDVAILRIICAVEAREVLIFVNRIDELADPAGEQDKIRKSIDKTLTRLGLAGQIEILFGSGYWANHAMGAGGAMIPRSRAALAHLYPEADLDDPETMRSTALEASGIQALHRAISKRVAEGPGAAILKDVQAEIDAIVEMGETVKAAAGDRRDSPSGATAGLSPDEARARVDAVRDAAIGNFETAVERVRHDLRERLERAQETFVSGALVAIQSHVEMFGDSRAWTHDPTSLRMMMKTAFARSCMALRTEGENALDEVFDGVQDILHRELGVFRKGASIEFPQQPQHQSPTVLARTLSLDLGGSWWKRFWRFGRKDTEEARYREILLAETTPLIDDLLNGFFEPAVERTRAIVRDFANDQGRFVAAICECAGNNGDTNLITGLHRMSA